MILELRNIEKKYRSKNVLTNINLQADKGEIIALVGENGCGKSTLFKILLGLAKQTSGEVLIDKSIKVSGILEEPAFYNYLDAKDNITLLLKNKKDNEDYLNQFGINDYLYKKVKKFSQGMKQRLAISYVLLEDPQIIILDEPTNTLDPVGIEILKNVLLKEKEKGKLILISSHDLYFLNDFVDKVYFLIGGELQEKTTALIEENFTNSFDYIFEFNDVNLAVPILKELGIEYKVNQNKIYILNYKDEINSLVKKFINFGLTAFYKDTNLSKEYVKIVKSEK